MNCAVCDQPLKPSIQLSRSGVDTVSRGSIEECLIDSHYYAIESDYLDLQYRKVNTKIIYADFINGYLVYCTNYQDHEPRLEIGQGSPEIKTQQIHNIKTIYFGINYFTITKNILEELKNFLILN